MRALSRPVHGILHQSANTAHDAKDAHIHRVHVITFALLFPHVYAEDSNSMRTELHLRGSPTLLTVSDLRVELWRLSD